MFPSTRFLRPGRHEPRSAGGGAARPALGPQPYMARGPATGHTNPPVRLEFVVRPPRAIASGARSTASVVSPSATSHSACRPRPHATSSAPPVVGRRSRCLVNQRADAGRVCPISLPLQSRRRDAIVVADRHGGAKTRSWPQLRIWPSERRIRGPAVRRPTDHHQSSLIQFFHD